MMRPEGHFPTTQWTLIARLRSGDHVESQKALDELCAQYYYPLYCYTRRRGLKHHDAQDALQDFMARLLRQDSLKKADMEKGRLRTFLATALQRFLINRHRDGLRNAKHLSIDADVEQRYEQEHFSDALTPEKVLEQSWAATVLQMAVKDLEEAEKEAGRGEMFEALEPYLTPGGEVAKYEAVALALGLNEAAVRQGVKRLRAKFRTCLRKRVAETLGQPSASEIDEEMKVLRAAMQ